MKTMKMNGWVLALVGISLYGAIPAFANTYYIAGNGSDSNPGTSASAPWAHAPGMPTCTATCASVKPQPGDKFIFKGGDTWGASNWPWIWSWAGTSTNMIYIGVDKTWYSGASWARPIMDAGGATISGKNVLLTLTSSSGYEHIDDFEFTNLYWNDSGCVYLGDAEIVDNAGTSDLSNSYFYGWTRGPNGGDCYQAEHSMRNVYRNVVDGSASGDDNGEAFGGVTNSAYDNVVHDVVNAIVSVGSNSIYDNLFYNLVTSCCGVHGNAIEIWTVADNQTDWIYGNVIHDNATSATQVINTGQNGQNATFYVFDNIVYSNAWGGMLIDGQGTGSCTGTQPACIDSATAHIWNNTVQVSGSATPCITIQTRGLGNYGEVDMQNNHCISDYTGSQLYIITGGDTVNTLIDTPNLLMSNTTAASDGYTSSQTYAFSPTSGSSPTVGTGTNLTSSWPGGISTDDTGYACTYVLASESVSCPARTQNTRPSSGAWDVGAYEFTGTVNSAPPSPPSDLSATVN